MKLLLLTVILLVHCLRDVTGLFDEHYADAKEKFRARNTQVDTIVSIFADMLDENIANEKNDLILIKGYDDEGKTIHTDGISSSMAKLLELYISLGRENRERQMFTHELLVTDLVIPMMLEREKVNASINEFDILRSELGPSATNETFAGFQAGRTQLMTVMGIEQYLRTSSQFITRIAEVMQTDVEEGKEYSKHRKWIMSEIKKMFERETGEQLFDTDL